MLTGSWDLFSAPPGILLQHCSQNSQALAHLFHADKVAVVTIASRADRHIKFQILIAEVRLVFAQIPIHAAAAQIRAAQTVIDGHLLGDNSQVAQAIHPNAVAREQGFRLAERDSNSLRTAGPDRTMWAAHRA